MLELYHWEPNTSSLKPLVVLHEKGLDFTSRYVDFSRFEQYALPDIASAIEVQHNPDGEGPILVHRGVPMTEAFFITLYLDEAFPQMPLRTVDAFGRWRVLMWARFLDEVLAPAVNTLGCRKYLTPRLKTGNRAEIERAMERVPTEERRGAWLAALNGDYSEDLIADSRRKIGIAVKKVENALADSGWIAGKDYSLADIDAFSLFASLPGLAPDLLDGASRTAAWLERIRARPAVKAAFATSKTGAPLEAFAPGTEHSRWG